MRENGIRGRHRRRYKATTNPKHNMPVADNLLDLYNREVVGWSMKPHTTIDIVTDALAMAWFCRRPAVGLLHHSDRGSQYASHAFQAKLAEYGMRCSMSRKGYCWDNAPTESWFDSFKNERVFGERFETREQIRLMTFEEINMFYNRQRMHSTLGYWSPLKVYIDWCVAHLQGRQVA